MCCSLARNTISVAIVCGGVVAVRSADSCVRCQLVTNGMDVHVLATARDCLFSVIVVLLFAMLYLLTGNHHN